MVCVIVCLSLTACSFSVTKTPNNVVYVTPADTDADTVIVIRNGEKGVEDVTTYHAKVDHFKNAQRHTVTPHGKIKLDTVQETSDGRIQYQTSDGRTWRVEMNKQPDGFYRYENLTEVK
jgi:hypothetical protein